MRFLRFNVQGNIQTCPESARPVKMEADTHQQQNLTENGFAYSMLEMEADSSQGSSAPSTAGLGQGQGFSILAAIFQLPCCLVIIFHVSSFRSV